VGVHGSAATCTVRGPDGGGGTVGKRRDRHLRSYDTGTQEVRSAILVSLLGSAGASTLKKAGVEIGRRSTAVALERLPARILTEINKRVGFQLVVKTGEKGVLNLAKWVPLVGGPIGAAVDGFSCKAIATFALRTFEPQRPRAVPV
jgi:hypothetical protein